MADFDRNLNPIIKPDTSSRPVNIPVGPVKNIPVPGVAPMHFANSDGVSDLSQGEDVFSKLNRLMKEGSSGPQAIGVNFKTLQENQRYRTFNPTIDDQEDFAAYGQSELDKAANGVLKGTALAATTVAGGFASLVGAGTAIFTGKLSDIWDNPAHRLLDEINTQADNQYLPNYYSRKESEAAWYDRDNWMTTNFLFDKLIKNSGFAVGAMVGGNLANAGLLRLGAGIGRAAAAGATVTEASQAFKLFTPLLRNTSRAFSSGKNLEAAAILENQIGSIADLSQRTARLGQLSKQTSLFAGMNDAVRRTAIAMYSSGGEAAFEALHTGKEMRETLIQEYIRQNGSEPIGKDLEAIESEVEQVGKIAFLGNMALLSVTEYAQLPFLLGSSYSTSRRTANSLLGETDNVILREGKYMTSAPSKFGKISKKVTGVGRYFFDPKEGAQEIGQYALSVGTQNYFDKASQSNDANVWVDGIMYGLTGVDERGNPVGAFNSKEGIEGGILGAITGGLMQARGNYTASRGRRMNTDEFVSSLNTAPSFRDAYKDKLSALNRGVVLQQQYNNAILLNDRQEANDLKYDMGFNYLSPRIKYGRFDMVMEDIADLRNSSMTEDGLAELKQQGIGNIDDTVLSFQARLDALEKDAGNINNLYQSLNLRYSGVVDENNQKLYPPQVIDKLVYASSKIANYDERIPMLTNTLSLSGIVTSDILGSITKTGKPDTQFTLAALNQINEMDVTSDVKDELKLLLQDVIELGMRRKMFINEYDAIKTNPLNYVRTGEAGEPITGEVEVSQKATDEADKKIKLEVGRSYSLSEPVRMENGRIVLAPKIKVNATTLAGEYEVELPDGTTSFLSPEQFEKYNITEGENQTQEYEDLLNQAVDDVFNYTANKDLEKPTGNKLEYVNNLDDPKIVSAVYNRFNKLAEELLKAKAERQRQERELAKSQEAIRKQQAELQKDSGDVPSIPTPDNARIDTGETGLLKPKEIFFTSTTTESEEYNDPTKSAPHITRSRVFLNNAGNFKNRADLRTIPFTFNQEEALGLSGITRLSYNVREDKFNSAEFQAQVNDVNNGFVATVFVEKASNGKLHFVNQEGKRIGEVGKPVDLSQVIFQTMPTTAISDSRGNDKYRSGEKDEFIAYSKAWEKRRQDLFSSSEIQNYQFAISRGIAREERDVSNNFVRSNISILVPEKTISGYEGLLKVSTLGTISHQGKNVSVPTGLTVIQHEDVLEILSNNKLGKSKADALFQVINSLVGEMMSQSNKGSIVTLNPAYMSYIQNVLFYKEPVGVAAGNQFWINKDSITIGASTYLFSEIANRETEIVNQLRDTYHSINNKTLTKRFNEEFFEYTFDSNKLKTKKWKNYQTYLLSGKDRDISETPLVTNVAKPTESIPYTHAAKYATMINMNLDVQISKQPVVQTPPPPKPPAPPVVPKTNVQTVKVGNYTINDDSVNEYTFKAGGVEFKAEQTPEGNISVTLVDSQKTKDTIAIIAKNKPVVEAAKKLVNDSSSLKDEELAAVFAATKISKELTDLYNSTVSKPADKAPEPPQAPKVEDLPPADDTKTIDPSKFKPRGGNPVYRRVGVNSSSRITEREIELFKEWHAKNIPNIPFRVLENVLTTYDNKSAWGVFENGVAKFYKGAIKGTEYHEAFEGIWASFLSSSEQQAILDEFKNQSGDFLDRETGRRIPYIQATDNQARERIADDFADFRTAKIKATSLGSRVVEFFRNIINFFRSFISKPSLKDQLFTAIEAGKFREYSVPAEVVADTEARYSRIPGVTETQANEFVQDMSIVISSFVFNPNLSDKAALYNIKDITGDQVYNHVKEVYTSYGAFEELGQERFDQLYQRATDYMRTLGVDIAMDEQVSINDESTNKNDYAPEPFATDWKKASRFAVKFSLATLPESTNQVDENGIPILKQSSISGYVLSNFSKTFANLLDKLSNTTLAKLDDKLISLIKSDGNYARVFTRLGGDLSSQTIPFDDFTKSDWRFFIQFYQTFTKQKPDAVVQFISGDGSTYSAQADQFSESKKLVRDWFENFKIASRSKDTLLKFNRDKKEYYVDTESDKFPKKIPSTPSEMINFLDSLGIKFSIEDYLDLSEQKTQGQKKSNRNKFAEDVSALYTYLSKTESFYSIDGKTLGVSGPLNSLASLYIRSTSPNQDNTQLNVEGKRVQKYADNNYTSVFENEFNEASNLDEFLLSRPELRDVYSQNSIVLQRGGKFFDEDGDRTGQIKISTIQGTYNDNDRSGISTASLNKGRRFTQELNQNLNGNYYILIPADSSTEWMINLGTQGSFAFTNTEAGWQGVYDTFTGYLKDEVALALDYENRQALVNVKSKAKQLRMFKDILPADMVNRIHSMVNEEASQAEIELYISTNQDKVNQAIQEMLISETEATKQLLVQNGEVVRVPAKREDGFVFKYENLDSDFLNSNDLNKNSLTEAQLDNVLLFANINYAIANVEMHKILFGDPYQFKIKDGKLDETKRIKSFLSPRRTTFDSVDYNNFLNENYNDAQGIPLDSEDMFTYEFKSYISTVTLGDVELVTPLFSNVNETDGFSILSLPAYREIKLKNGEWSDEAEDFLQWDNSYARQKLSNKGRYTYTNSKLEAADKAAIAKRKPDFKSEVLKPIVSGVKHNQGRIELVLDKFSQMPISYQAVEGTSLEELYIKMLNEKHGYVIFESGRKVGIRSMSSLYNSDGTLNTEPFNPASIENVSWKSYGIQVENSYEDKDQTRGSQLTKLASLDMFDGGEEVISGARQEYERNMQILDQMHNNSYRVLLEKLGIEDLGDSYTLVDPTAVSDTLQYELLRREASENMKDTLRLDENGEFRIPFESSPAYKQIKDILYSIVHKSLISPTMNGKPHVQVPATLWENAKEGRGLVRKIGKEWVKITRSQYNALSEEDKKNVRLTSDTLKFYEDENGKRYCEIMLPHWFKDKLDRNKYPDDKAILKYLNNTKEGQKILSGIGFRIPTQAASSVEVFRVKKFLDPSMGSTVVVPSEITSKAGSDFDIDKLNMYLKSIYIDKAGNIRLIEYKGSEQATKDFYRGVYEENIQTQLDKIENGDEFRDKLLEVFDIIESVENPEEMTGEGLMFLLGDDLADFYDYHQYLIQNIIEQAASEGLNPSDYIANQMSKLANKFEKLNLKLLNDKLKKDYVDRVYKKSLENEYYDSLEKLISLPGNFKRIVNPIGNAGLDMVAAELDTIKGETEAEIKNKLISRSFMTSLRHAFVLGKKWVGIAAVNITGHSLTQKSKVFIDPVRFENISDYDRKFLGDGSTFLPHNAIDGKISLSGVMTADGSEYISDRLSGYATGFVDVAKDPYIMKIVESDLTVGIAMFMERIGAGETTAWFLQQPIVSQYIQYIEGLPVGQSHSLFNSQNIANIEALYPTEQDLTEIEVKPSQFISNLEKYYSGEEISDMDNAVQRRIFQEFLKMAKMSQYSFSFSQAYNYDTTKFRDSDAFEKKMVRTDITRDENIITSIDNVLNTSFIGDQKTFIEKAINSMGAIIKTELEVFKKYTQDVIRPYQENQYLSADKFEQISARLKSSFLDFIIFTKNPKFKDVYSTLLSGDTSTASKLPAIQEKYPNMKLLQDLRVESSQREGGAATIKLAVQARDAYDQNLYTEMMRELRDLEPRFYKELVTVAVLQGNYNSAISIKSIIPIEDYSKIIKPIIDSLQPHTSLQQFADDAMFFRNNWRNEDVVPTAKNIRMFFPYQQGMQMDVPVAEDQVGNEIYQYISMMFPVIKGIQDKPSSRQILTLNPIYDRGNHIDSDFIKVPKIFERRVGKVATGEYVNLFTGRTFTSYQRAQALKKGDLSIYDYVGYKKVKYSNGEPVLTAKGEHLYKMVNLYGDGSYAIEYPVSLGPSVFNNGSVKVEQEIPDAEIIKYFGGEPESQEQIPSPTTQTSPSTDEVLTGEFLTISDFPIEQKETILVNFASKYKMDRQKALTYINEALSSSDRESVIQKLKDCY